jgi:hypothetical protein
MICLDWFLEKSPDGLSAEHRREFQALEATTGPLRMIVSKCGRSRRYTAPQEVLTVPTLVIPIRYHSQLDQDVVPVAFTAHTPNAALLRLIADAQGLFTHLLECTEVTLDATALGFDAWALGGGDNDASSEQTAALEAADLQQGAPTFERFAGEGYRQLEGDFRLHVQRGGTLEVEFVHAYFESWSEPLALAAFGEPGQSPDSSASAGEVLADEVFLRPGLELLEMHRAGVALERARGSGGAVLVARDTARFPYVGSAGAVSLERFERAFERELSDGSLDRRTSGRYLVFVDRGNTLVAIGERVD